MYYIICSTRLKRSVKLFHRLKVHHKERVGKEGWGEREYTAGPNTVHGGTDFRNLHLLPVPLSRSNNVPQNMGDGWDTGQTPKRPSTTTVYWATYWSFLFALTKDCILNILFLNKKKRICQKGGLFLACGMVAGSCMYKWSLIFFFGWCLMWYLAHSDHQCLFRPQHNYTELFSATENAARVRSSQQLPV